TAQSRVSGSTEGRPRSRCSWRVALGVRADGQKMLLAIKSMGGEGEAAWRALLDDLVRRGLRTPALVVIDGAPGLEKAVAAHAKQFKRANRALRTIRTYLGRVIRDIGCKIRGE